MNAFLVKKLVSNLVHLIPGLLLLILLALAVSRWYPKVARGVILLATIMLIAAASPLGSNSLVSYLENQHPVVQQLPLDTHSILVLGSGHTWAQDRPPNSVLSAVSLSRISEGVRLWKQQPASFFITSGAPFNSEVAHAEVSANMAEMSGVAADKIVRFSDTLDTAHEIRRLISHVRENPIVGKDRVVIVSSATHLPRAALMMEEFDIPYTLAPTDFLYVESPWYLFSSMSLSSADRAIHEYVGMLWHWIASDNDTLR